jgi:hypothetical protein
VVIEVAISALVAWSLAATAGYLRARRAQARLIRHAARLRGKRMAMRRELAVRHAALVEARQLLSESCSALEWLMRETKTNEAVIEQLRYLVRIGFGRELYVVVRREGDTTRVSVSAESRGAGWLQ